MASRVRGIVLVSAMVFSGILFATPVYGENADYIVDVETSLGVELTANDVTLNLFPNNHMFEGKNLGVSVTTNNPTGYVLSMTSTGTNLINTADSTKTIPTLATLAGGYTEDTFTTNRWGYRVGTSGNYFAYTSGVTIADKRTLVDSDTTTVGFAGKIDYTQPTGTYTLPIVFTMVPNIVLPQIQKMTIAKCPTTPTLVTDVRDNEQYYIQKLADGNCWMLDNLRLDPNTVSLEMLKGNTNASDQSLTYLKKGGGSTPYTSSPVSAASFNVNNAPRATAAFKDQVPTHYGAGSGKRGVYYNICAASAGTFCYANGQATGATNEDLCPVGWRMPIGGRNAPANEYTKLYNAYGSNAGSFANALSIVIAGIIMSNNQVGYTASAYVLSATTNNGSYHSYLAANAGQTNTGGDANFTNASGMSIRCILK